MYQQHLNEVRAAQIQQDRRREAASERSLREASAVRSGPVPAFPHFPGGADCRRGPHRALDPHLPRADQRARLNSAPTSSRHSERSEESRLVRIQDEILRCAQNDG
jgi:hypothetical protein